MVDESVEQAWSVHPGTRPVLRAAGDLKLTLAELGQIIVHQGVAAPSRR